MAEGSVRPVSRSKSAGRFGRQSVELSNRNFDDVDSELNVRVKERDPTAAVEERPRNRLMSAIFRGVGGSGGDPMPSAEQRTNELKETLKRPLSSLFRRTHSQPDHRNAPPTHNTLHGSTSGVSSTFSPPQQQPSRLAPTGRSPIVVGSSQQQQQQKGTVIGRSSGIANGSSSSIAAASSAVSTTATRPFSGFPGRRPAPPTSQTSSAYGQSVDGGEQPQRPSLAAESTLNIGLSEQAAIAPQISMRRLSGLSYGSVHNFGRRDGGGDRGNSGKMGGEIDVNFLSRFLCPEDETGDERIPWNWDSLFASVSSELREEWALEEEANNGEMPSAAGGMAGELGGAMPNGLLGQQQKQGRRTDKQQRG